jgi:hypothetical protein
VLLEMVTDPNIPPAPPHLTGKQLRAYATALVKGDRDAIATVMAAARQWWSGLFPPEEDEAAAPQAATTAFSNATGRLPDGESAAGEEDPGALPETHRGRSSE